MLYSLSHWARAELNNQFARLQINWLDQDTKLVEASIDIVLTSQERQRRQMTVTPPDTAVLAQVYVSVREDSTVWFDDIHFEAGEGTE